MFAIRIDLLTGRYSATHASDRKSGEWPPHPHRIFAALVAANATGDAGLTPAQRDSLQWLESLDPPEVWCSSTEQIAKRAVLDHFVPVNNVDAVGQRSAHDRIYLDLRSAIDASEQADHAQRPAEQKKAATALRKATEKAVSQSAKWAEPGGHDGMLAVLPGQRNKQARTFPVTAPLHDTILFVWPDAAPSNEVLDTLDEMTAAVARLGHSSSMVACSTTIAPAAFDELTHYRPADRGEIDLRTLAAGTLEELERDYQRHRGNEPRVFPAPVTAYSSRQDRESHPWPEMTSNWVVLGLSAAADKPRRQAPVHIGPNKFLALADAVRSSVIRYSTSAAAPVIAGHAADGSPVQSAHLAVVPLPFVGRTNADGGARSVALVLPHNDPDAVRFLGLAVSNWVEAGGQLWGAGLPRMQIQVLDPENRPETARPRRWCQLATSWATATPIVLPRFPGELFSHNPAKANAAHLNAQRMIAQCCEEIGLPRPISVHTAVDPQLIGSRRSGNFPRFRRSGSAVPPQIHASLTFASPVHGPLLLGAGRYLGYGLLAPVDAAASAKPAAAPGASTETASAPESGRKRGGRS